MSYPDLLYDGDWYVTETQKSQARIHRIEKRFIEKLCGQFAQSVQDCGAPGILCELSGRGLNVSGDCV